ncbi:hypothetical protein Hypma_009990 [Hypsizygus marmoreus]|uniref:Uncharacterized protein n=1 Tax=Hypsizygus marmoreus TaxID=39966 RepID=A0A369JMU1_HYPMA|nr:hypothetical protein Hypma_009990 [Hypsizygus marmoreus]
MANETNEDDIDLEALQAQIDLSMSFAQNMVSSWVKPSRKLPKGSRDTEAELKEYMRRPPRLGVGAPIPETANLSRETARLKGQLTGKGSKRAREEDHKKLKEKSDDEDESRAGAIQKKARVDPFGDNRKNKNKKNKKAVIGSTSSVVLEPHAPAETDASEQAEVVDMITDVNPERDAVSVPPSTPRRKKRKKRHSTVESPMISVDKTPMLVSPPSTSALQPARTTPDGQPRPLNSSRTPGKVIDISLTTTPINSPHIRNLPPAAALFKQPLLNLAPLASDDEASDDAKTDLAGDSPKKKRKRKRRKKKNSFTSDGVMDGPKKDGG